MAPKAPSTAWRNDLTRDSKGHVIACLPNLTSILGNEPCWQGVLAYNEFTEQIVKTRPPPWHVDDAPAIPSLVWEDGDAARLASWFTRSEGLKCPATHLVEDAVKVTSARRRHHPVREWLKSLRWDKKSRLDTWLIRLGGAEDNLYTRAVGAMFAIGAVARIFEPGCKVDHTLILEAKQGLGKSTLLRELVGATWFLETESELGDKDSFQQLRGKWVVELAELDSLSRADLSRVKAFLTKCVDTYRESYGRHTKDFPRQIVFTGSTNETEYLKDDTGNRRFWPVRLTKIDLAKLRREREQIWAEAVARYMKGEKWHVTDRALLGIFETEQEARRQADPFEPMLARYVVEHTNRLKGVTVEECLKTIGFKGREVTRYDTMRVGTVLRKLGWERTRTRTSGGTLEYLYMPGESEIARATAAYEARQASKKALEDELTRENKLHRLGETLTKGRRDQRTSKKQDPKVPVPTSIAGLQPAE